MLEFGFKDLLDIFIVAILLYYVYRLMRESGMLNMFYGIMAFIVVWLLASEIFALKLIGSILDKVMSIGVLILVIVFQDQIKRFLIDIGSQHRWSFFRKIFRHNDTFGKDVDIRAMVMPIVYACMSMSKTKTGALIVIQQNVPLEPYEKTGDIINATINQRLIENIFFKNSPLHDGAMIIADGQIKSVGCILPVSHDTSIPRALGLRHRAALGIAQATDALAIVVSEETGNISVAERGTLETKLSTTDLENRISRIFRTEAE